MTATAITREWIEDYQKKGAGVLRQVIGAEWIGHMRDAIAMVLGGGSNLAMNLASDKGAFFNDLFLWRWNEEFRRFIFDSPLPELAAAILQTDDVRLFYDQLFVMEPGGETGTPWHQDLPYWPIKGPDVLSIWVPFDPVSPDNGVVSYVAGSHLWQKRIRPASPRLTAAGEVDTVSRSDDAIAFDPKDAAHEYLTWTLEPGDVLVHHGMTVHGAPPNSTTDLRRRALAVRYVGPETRYDPRPGTWIHDSKVRAYLPLPDLQPGDPLDCDLFPKVWPRK
jgi:ectoine hydroxylase-related dioxygenase (phytanoyl-CoA dioxygenase family)